MIALRKVARLADPRRSAFGSLALVAAVYTLTLGRMESREFWIGDNAVKFLQVEALESSGFRDFALPWPGHRFDPDYRYNPLPAPFTRVVDGRLFAQYPPVFTLASAVLHRAFGVPGLYLLPMLGALLALGAVAALTGEAAPGLAPRHAAVLIAGFCTPLWFYAVEFWEHTLALGLSLWAIHRVLLFLRYGGDRNLSAAGLLLALAAAIREESLLLVVVLFALVLADAPRQRWRATRSLALSLGAALVPLLAFQAWAVGRPLGLHVQSNLTSFGGHLASRGEVIYRLLLADGPAFGRSLLLTGPFVVAFFWRPRLPARAFRLALPIGALAALAATLLASGPISRLPGRIAQVMSSNSLFPAAPVLALALLGVRPPTPAGARNVALDRLHRIAAGFVVAYAIAAPEISSRGIHWGNRFLLLVYPLLAVLAAANLELWRGLAGRQAALLALPLACVVVASCATQADSIALLRARKEFSAAVRGELGQHPEPAIVTDVWWAGQELFADFYRRPIFFVQTRAQLADLSSRLRAGGVARALFVTSAIARPPLPGAVIVDDRGLGYFSLALRSVALAPAAAGPAAGAAAPGAAHL